MRLRLLAPAVSIAALLLTAGCSLLGDDYSDIAPGTFRFRADGQVYTGTAIYRPRLDLPFSEAAVYLTPADGPFMFIGSDDFLTAEAGDRFEPRVQFQLSDASYHHLRGSVTVVSVSEDYVEGQFSFRLEDLSTGPVTSDDISAEGGFYARLAEE